MQPGNLKALEEYKGTGLAGVVEESSPEEVVRMLLDGFMTRVSAAEGHMRRGETQQRLEAMSKAIGIVGGLKSSLDLEAGGEMAERWDALYDYVARRLFEANVKLDPAMLAECRDLMGEIRDAWTEAVCQAPAETGEEAR